MNDTMTTLGLWWAGVLTGCGYCYIGLELIGIAHYTTLYALGLAGFLKS